MSNIVWLYISIATFLVAYVFYAYTLFSKEGFDGVTIRLFLAESMLFTLAFVFCIFPLQDIVLRLTIGFFAVAAMSLGLSIALIARHVRDRH